MCRFKSLSELFVLRPNAWNPSVSQICGNQRTIKFTWMIIYTFLHENINQVYIINLQSFSIVDKYL